LRIDLASAVGTVLVLQAWSPFHRHIEGMPAPLTTLYLLRLIPLLAEIAPRRVLPVARDLENHTDAIEAPLCYVIPCAERRRFRKLKIAPGGYR
jgi:hypothetical protein